LIDVLVVDDDFRVAQVHAGFVDLVPGFRVAGRARTAADARAKAAGADLVLLDVYLPDESGLDLLPGLSADVIMATPATDPESVRTALSRGALHYLIKPFTAAELGERLRAYARYRSRLAAGDRLTQTDVDRALGLLHDVTRSGGPANPARRRRSPRRSASRERRPSATSRHWPRPAGCSCH
jgi:response regulator of citrate/malate metabolism